MPVTYFVTGANRGIGFAIVKIISENPDNLVVATTRSFERARELYALEKSNLEVIEYDTTHSVPFQRESLAKLKFIAEHGIDVFIQNAGIFNVNNSPIHEEPPENFTFFWEGNTLASIKAYQAVYPHLIKPTGNTKKTVFISSLAGTIGDLWVLTKGYGLSKAGINFIAKHIALENAQSENSIIKDSITISLHPGVVSTDMGNLGVQLLEEIGPLAITPTESAENIVKVVSEVRLEQTGGFLGYTGETMAY